MSRRRWGCGCAALLALSAALCAGAGCAGVSAAWVAAVVAPGAPAEAPVDGRFVEAGDVALFVIERGPADGPAALFVHGSGAWSGTWEPVLDGLAARGIRAIAVDMPPFGYSERPADVSRPAQARRLVAAAASLGLERYTLVGHSFGGGATVEAALLAPDRVEGLVLVAAALGVDAPPGQLGPLAPRPARVAAAAATFTNPWFTPIGLRAFAARDAAVIDAVIERYRRPLGRGGSTDAVADWLPELLAPAPSPSMQSVEYTRLTMPTRLVWGDADTATPPDQARQLLAWLPDGELELWPGVGHLPQVEDPDALVRSIGDFVESVSSR